MVSFSFRRIHVHQNVRSSHTLVRSSTSDSTSAANCAASNGSAHDILCHALDRIEPPSDALLLGILKSIEIELQKREFTRAKPPETAPLWYLAETERNVFLWRNGMGLDDRQSFHFWIDVPALIRKRIRQLDSGSSNNPFVNSTWGSAPIDRRRVEEDLQYMEDFLHVYPRVAPHAEALSHASIQIQSDLGVTQCSTTHILLPSSKVHSGACEGMEQ